MRVSVRPWSLNQLACRPGPVAHGERAARVSEQRLTHLRSHSFQGSSSRHHHAATPFDLYVLVISAAASFAFAACKVHHFLRVRIGSRLVSLPPRSRRRLESPLPPQLVTTTTNNKPISTQSSRVWFMISLSHEIPHKAIASLTTHTCPSCRLPPLPQAPPATSTEPAALKEQRLPVTLY